MAAINCQIVCLLFLFQCTLPNYASVAELAPSEFMHRRLLLIETELISMFKLITRLEEVAHDEKESHALNTSEVKNFVEEKEPLNLDALENEAFYTSHPVGLYILTKRLAIEWRPYVEMLQKEKICGQPLNDKLTNIAAAMPSKKDLTEAAYNLVNLQRLYRLKTFDIANGVIAKNKTQPLTPRMCYDIAMAAEDRLEYYYAVQWYEQAIEDSTSQMEVGKLAATSKKNKEHDTVRRAAMQGLAAVYYKVKHVEKAVEVARKALEIGPSNPSLAHDLQFYERVYRDGGYTELDLKPWEPKDKLTKLYEGLCTGRISQPIRRLSCYYQDAHNPFIRVRVEVIRKNPRIVMYHNAYSAGLSGVIERKVRDLLQDTVVTKKGYSKDRQWAMLFKNNYHVAKLSKRQKQLTKLDYDLSDSSYLAFNYGTGIPRSPFIDLNDIALHGKNSSTFMVFLNNVHAGGGLVFPWVKTVVQPEMGSALFWYNTKPTGKIDKRLLWGECPILLGSKWMTFRVLKDYVNDPPKYGNLKVDLWEK